MSRAAVMNRFVLFLSIQTDFINGHIISKPQNNTWSDAGAKNVGELGREWDWAREH